MSSYYNRRAEAGDARARRIYDLTHPQPVVTMPVHVNPALLGTPAERDAFADLMLAQERANNAAAQSDELASEGRCHVNTRAARHE